MDWFDEFQKWLGGHSVAANALGVLGVIVAFLALFALTRLVLLRLIRRLVVRSKFTWDDELVESRFFRWVTMVVPTYVVRLLLPINVLLDEVVQAWLGRIAIAFMAFAIMMAIGALLTAVNAVYEKRPDARNRPIKGYVQVAKILLYSFGTIIVVALLADQELWPLITGLGAFTAVLLLIFKDTILSLVASVQLTSNNLVRVGDWIEVPALGVDGDVVDIALHTVKVKNFDNTVSSVPTHQLIVKQFKNWRAMSESGGRRIKRSIALDMTSVRFLSEKEIGSYGESSLLKDYIAAKKVELAAHNETSVSRRHLTNLGTFRAYLIAYLRNHPKIHQDGMTFLVRQLAPSETGVGIELYVFTTTTAWVEYEGIQADIFDHIIAIVPEFGLRVFQSPSGSDFAKLAAPEA